MDKHRDSGHHTHKPSQEELMEMWHDPNRFEEALQYVSPAQLRKGIHEVALEEQAAAKQKSREHLAPPVDDKRTIRDTGKNHERFYPGQQADQLEAEQRMRQEYLNSHPQPERIKHPGYAPDSDYAPPPPDSPAYEAAYDREPPRFYGVDLGVLRLGVNSNGSLDVGVNVGLAKAGVQVGLENRVDGEFMPIGGPLHARAGAGIGINRNGIHSEVGAGANFFNVVNGDADFGARLGRNTGVDGDVRGRAFPVNVQADAGANVGPDGVNAYTGANTDIAGQAGVRAGAHFDVDRYNSGVAAGVGLKAGDRTLDFGPSIRTEGNRTFHPGLNLEPGFARRRTFYPTGNRSVDES